MSMHTPFAFAGLERYQRLVEERLKTLGIPAAQHEAYLRQKNIYASILYTDDALRRFFTRVAEQPAWRNTVFVVTGDHRLPEIEMASRLERYHVPLIVYSPMLHAPMRIKALSSHFDVAPSLVAMLSHRYGWATPQRVHWMGAGLDVHTQWRNLHTLPLKQTKTELSDYISGEYYLAQDRLMSLQDALVAEPEDNPAVLQAMHADDLEAVLAIEFGVHGTLDHTHSQWASFHDGFRPLHYGVFELIKRHHLIDHSHFFRFFCGILIT